MNDSDAMLDAEFEDHICFLPSRQVRPVLNLFLISTNFQARVIIKLFVYEKVYMLFGHAMLEGFLRPSQSPY